MFLDQYTRFSGDRYGGLVLPSLSPQFVVIRIVKGFSIVNEAEADVFWELPCFLHDPMNIGNLVSGSSASSKPSLYISKFLVHVLLKPSLKDFEQKPASM